MDFLSYPSNLFKVVTRKMFHIYYGIFGINLRTSCFNEKFDIHMNGQSTRKLVKIALLKVRQSRKQIMVSSILQKNEQ